MGLNVGRYVLTKNNIKKLAGTGGSTPVPTPVPVDKNFLDLTSGTIVEGAIAIITGNKAEIQITLTEKGKTDLAEFDGFYNTIMPNVIGVRDGGYMFNYNNTALIKINKTRNTCSGNYSSVVTRAITDPVTSDTQMEAGICTNTVEYLYQTDVSTHTKSVIGFKITQYLVHEGL